MKALVIGGTGPTGPHIVQGLLSRGFDVTILHRGLHEIPELRSLEHVHADPFASGAVEAAVGARHFDMVVSMYGRLRLTATALAGRCERFLAAGSISLYAGYLEPGTVHPYGMPLMTAEAAPPVAQIADGASELAIDSYRVHAAETHLMSLHRQGAFSATCVRYPVIYGPRSQVAFEWTVIKRVLDRRPVMVIPDGGLAVVTRCAARNAAHVLLLALDRPHASAGQSYNCADQHQFTIRQWVELILGHMGASMELLSMPDSLAWPGRALLPRGRPSSHDLVDIRKAEAELGYTDVIAAPEALYETVDHHLALPPGPDGRAVTIDSFDYLNEDRLISAYRRGLLEISTKHPVPAATIQALRWNLGAGYHRREAT
jgi:nucleoside-diphosphate-sugar epimerase